MEPAPPVLGLYVGKKPVRVGKVTHKALIYYGNAFVELARFCVNLYSVAYHQPTQ